MMVEDIETLKALRERERESYNLRNKKGITLIALIITIIILLLLAGISVSMISGQDGILAKASKSKQVTELKTIEEQINLMMADKSLSSNGQENISEYVNLEQLGIDSKYSEFIGISNGEMYILSTADESLKSLANQYGIPVGNPSNVKDSSEMVLENTEEGILRNYRIYGNSVQEGEPSPTAPVEIQSMGNKLEDGTYEIPVTVKGKNLLDIDSMLNAALTKNTDGSYTITKKNIDYRFSRTIDIKLEANKTYTLSYELLETNSNYESPLQFVIIYKNGKDTSFGLWGKGEQRLYTPEEEVEKIRIYQEGSMPDGTYTTFKNLQIEEGNTATEYEPYKEIKTSIKLNAPLRKVGDYADYIDLKSQKVVRKIKEIEMLDDVNWFQYPDSIGKSYPCFSNFILLERVDSSTPILFSHNKEMNDSTEFQQMIQGYKLGVYANRYFEFSQYLYWAMPYNLIGTSKESTANQNLEAFRKWLKEQEEKETSPKIQYVIETKEERIKIPSLKTFKGRTYITIGTDIEPSNIEIES